MSLTIINSFASWVLKQRIHQIELFLKYLNEVQEELLMNCKQLKTLLGKRYDYGSITSYARFADQIPISTYEELQPLIERTQIEQMFLETPIKWFAKSSEQPMQEQIYSSK
jgi:hypothetical protein